MHDQSRRPVITVCIANYNGMKVIDACLQSVFKQDVEELVEVIVHDDASTDGSVAHLRRHYPNLILIESTENVGFCVANNRMVAKAQGQYILLLNNDAELFNDALRTLLTAARSYQNPAIMGLPQYAAPSGELIDRGCLLDPFFNPVPNLDPLRSEVAMIIGACFWIPRTIWDELEGFPDWFGSIGEDLFLCCKARLAGYSVVVLPSSGYRHWVGTSFGGGKVHLGKLRTTFRRRGLSERNKTYVMVMVCPSPILYLLLPIHMVLLIAEGLLLAGLLKEGRGLREIYLPIFKSAYLNRLKLIYSRKDIMMKSNVNRMSFFSAFNLMPYKLQMLCKHGLPNLK